MAAGEDTTDLAVRLAEVDALRRRVLNVIPHALRTPITTFRGLAEALSTATEEEIREQIAPALARLAAQSEHLLDDMLIAAGYTTALPTGPKVRTPVAGTARAVWAEVGLDARLDLEGEQDASVLVAEGSLFKMFVHLLDNGAKYGDGVVRVRIVVSGDRSKVETVVETDGEPRADLAMFTEPFYRGEAAVMRASGLGVGLTVAASLAEQAGGSLAISSLPGGGVRASLDLPSADAP